MKKSLIALAVAAALPVAAQADMTLSGDVAVTYTLGSNLAPTTIESSLSVDASEVLSNGMTATASFGVLGNTGGTGTVSLAGDFGTVKGGSAAATLEDSNDDDQDLNGISYSGSFAGISVAAAAGTWNHDGNAGTPVAEYTKYSADYDFNGLALGGSNTDGTTKLTASYSFGDLTVSGEKADGLDAVVTAAYAADMGDLAVAIEANSKDSDNWEVEATYTLGDISIKAVDGEAKAETELTATYASGALSVEVDNNSKVTVGYDMGNADFELVRDSAATTVKYTVAF
jgi:hypothetical protein